MICKANIALGSWASDAGADLYAFVQVVGLWTGRQSVFGQLDTLMQLRTIYAVRIVLGAGTGCPVYGKVPLAVLQAELAGGGFALLGRNN